MFTIIFRLLKGVRVKSDIFFKNKITFDFWSLNAAKILVGSQKVCHQIKSDFKVMHMTTKNLKLYFFLLMIHMAVVPSLW